MSTSSRLSIVRATLALAATLSGIVACSSTPEDSVLNAAASSDLSAGAAPQCSPQGTGVVAQGLCAVCCAGDGPAKPIFTTAGRCLQACGATDKACQKKCWTKLNHSCHASTATHNACTKAEQCATNSCFGGQDPNPGTTNPPPEEDGDGQEDADGEDMDSKEDMDGEDMDSKEDMDGEDMDSKEDMDGEDMDGEDMDSKEDMDGEDMDGEDGSYGDGSSGDGDGNYGGGDYGNKRKRKP